MTSEQKNIEKRFNGLFMDLDLTDEQAENISYLKRYVLEGNCCVLFSSTFEIMEKPISV